MHTNGDGELNVKMDMKEWTAHQFTDHYLADVFLKNNFKKTDGQIHRVGPFNYVVFTKKED